MARPVTGATKDKLKAIWRGPMRITKVISSHIFEVEDLLTKVVHKVHTQRIRFYKDSAFEITADIRAQLTHDTAAYEVESIKAHRYLNRWEMLIQWVGFESEDTWEPIVQLYKDVPGLVKQYLKSMENSKERSIMEKILRKQYTSFTL